MVQKKKTAKQLDADINAALAKPSNKERRDRAAESASAKKRASSDEYFNWRRETLDQIERWAKENNQEWDGRYRNWMIKRLDKLVLFLRSFSPEAGDAPIDPHDAAGLIVLPRQQALRFARRLFSGRGIAKDLQAEDLTYNMDWFRPKDFQ